MLRLEALTKRYGGFTAVDALTLHVPAGRIQGFLGPNGAGKTTTLKMIAGLIRPTGGRIQVGGHDVATEGLEARRILGYVPDRPYVHERLTGLEYCAFVAGLYGLDPKAARDRARELLRHFGLEARQQDLIESYSHGMKQRLVMASVLLHGPRVLIVDEPMVGLDPRGARLLEETLRRAVDAEGLAILLSTHTLDVADRLCDRVAVLHRGRLVAEGAPAELRAAQGATARLDEVFLQLTAEDDGAETFE